GELFRLLADSANLLREFSELSTGLAHLLGKSSKVAFPIRVRRAAPLSLRLERCPPEPQAARDSQSNARHRDANAGNRAAIAVCTGAVVAVGPQGLAGTLT